MVLVLGMAFLVLLYNILRITNDFSWAWGWMDTLYTNEMSWNVLYLLDRLLFIYVILIVVSCWEVSSSGS